MSLEREESEKPKASDPMPLPLFEEMFEQIRPGRPSVDRINFILGLLKSNRQNVINLTPAIVNELDFNERMSIYTEFANSEGADQITIARLFDIMISNNISELYRQLANNIIPMAINNAGNLTIHELASMYRNSVHFQQLLERVKSGTELSIAEWHVYFYTASDEQINSSFTHESMASLNKTFNDIQPDTRADNNLLNIALLKLALASRIRIDNPAIMNEIKQLILTTSRKDCLSPLHLSNIDPKLLFSSVDISALKILLRGANFDASQFTNTVIPRIDLVNVSMCNANFSRSTITGLDLMWSDLSGSQWNETNFQKRIVTFNNCRGIKSNFTGAMVEGMHFSHCDFSQVNMSNTQFNKLHLLVTNFSDAKFLNSNIQNVSLISTNFSRADFSSSTIGTARFENVDFQSASFQNSRFGEPILFINCNLIDVNLSGITFGEQFKLFDVKVLKLDHIRWDDPASDPKQELQKSLTHFLLYCQKHQYTDKLLHILRDAAAKQMITYIESLKLNDHEKLDLLKDAMSHQTFSHRKLGSKVAHGLVSTFSAGKMLSSSQKLFQEAIQTIEGKGAKQSSTNKKPR